MNGIIIVVIAAIASMVIAMLWFSPMLFGNIWMKASGMSAKEIKDCKKKGMAKSMTFAFIASVITAYILALFMGFAGASNVMQSATIAFLLWLGFAMPVELSGVLWEKKSVKSFIIGTSYVLVSMIAMSAIIISLA